MYTANTLDKAIEKKRDWKNFIDAPKQDKQELICCLSGLGAT